MRQGCRLELLGERWARARAHFRRGRGMGVGRKARVEWRVARRDVRVGSGMVGGEGGMGGRWIFV